MFTRDADQAIDGLTLFHWSLMSLSTGIMNAVAFVGLGMFATHVTGFATLLGVHLAHFQWGEAGTAMLVPVFFLLGSIISGLCIEARIRKEKTPHYDYVMYLSSILLLIAVYLSTTQHFTMDSAPFHLQHSFVLLSQLCMSSGLMNAALSHSSHSTVRIGHLTGVTTDLGRGIVELISFGNLPGREKVLRLSRLRIYSVVTFIAGSLLGAVLFGFISFKVLLLPAIYFAYAGEHGRKIKSSR